MRKELRLRHKAMETERAYVRWVQRFMRHCRSKDLEQFGEPQIKSFLSHLAVEGNVSAGTQDQAKCALLYLYQIVLGRELAFLDVTPANKPARLPVVLSREEIALLLPEFVGLKELMFLTMYGAGLRHGECRRLRVKDLCFDEGHIVVRNGKGDKDRITVLPERCATGFGHKSNRFVVFSRVTWSRDLARCTCPMRWSGSTRVRAGPWDGNGCFPHIGCQGTRAAGPCDAIM